MIYDKVTVERRGALLLIGLNRIDKRNAFDLEMYRQLALAYGELDRDSELCCGVLFAHGAHFTAGLDLTQWAPVLGSGRFPALPEGAIDPLGLDPAKQVKKPVVMAIQGLCLTMGVELLLATDIRVASTDARLAQLEVKRGIYAVGGATIRLVQELGWGNAMRYLLTGDEIDAHEAHRLGLVQELVEPGRQLERAVELAEIVAAQAPLAVQTTLASSRRARSEGERAAIERFFPDLVALMGTEDVQEGYRSFIERRAARFKGR